MSNSSPMMSLRNVGVYYRQHRGIFGAAFWALKDVSFDLHAGETLGIIGRNGAGKSTLMRLMAGIIRPNCGSLDNAGYSVSLLSLRLGFIPYLNGRENAVLSGMLMGMRRKAIQAELERIKDFSELGDFFERPINTYSSGMLARLGFSVAFQADPDILLVDEVLGVGDAEFNRKSTAAMESRIKANKTIVFVSHNGEMVRQLCDRAVWIENGETQIEGTPHQVLTEYHKMLRLDAKH